MKGLTVEQLMYLCAEQIKKGNGNKEIYISADEEGNRFNPLYYAINDDTSEIKQIKKYGAIANNVNTDKIVLLG